MSEKYFAAEGFNVKIPFISQAYTKAVAISFRQSHAKTRNLVNITQGSFLLNLSMRLLALMRMCARRVKDNLIDIAKYW